MKKKFNSDFIFLIGIFLLPFENFIFAPSAGWATITPIIFAIYIVFNFKFFSLKKLKEQTKKTKSLVCVFAAILVFNFLAYLSVGIDIRNVINAMVSIGLGFVNFISMFIYYEKNKNLNKIIKIIIISYEITLIIGIIEFLTIKFNITALYDFFSFIFKRNYMRNKRVQFFFTEPSFIGMHLFGILLPLYLLSKNKRILGLIITYIIASLVFNSGIRIIIDIIVVGLILMIYKLITKRKFIILLSIPIILILALIIGYNTNDRIRKIVDNGVYADGSLASRYFRIQSSTYGYIRDFPQVLIGYGVGNSLIPLRSGYEQAISKYKSSYVREMEELANPEFNDDSVSYCLYIRFISEFGLLFFALFMYYLIKITKYSSFEYKWPYFIINLYIYLQFESYAFYAIWLYILVMYYTKKT